MSRTTANAARHVLCRCLSVAALAAVAAAEGTAVAEEAAPAEAAASTTEMHYDAQVAWFHAGTIEMTLQEHEDRYDLSGMVTTSGAMNRLFKWRGQFAATGRFVEGMPRTNAYLLLEDDGATREVLLAFGDKTTIHATDDESEELPIPPGSDLMSIMFLAPHCLGTTTVHDGEDAYTIVPERTSERKLNQRSRYYSGPTVRCDYRFRYVDGSTRRVSVWMADARSPRFPVRIQIRVPLLPDGILRMRIDRASGSPGPP
ncbi:MAG: DUF3108 domain-containing protein [Pseudomonadales bacterium]|nr:DUF3108 domain-containing protein [Pseudomonadales bacterium]